MEKDGIAHLHGINQSSEALIQQFQQLLASLCLKGAAPANLWKAPFNIACSGNAVSIAQAKHLLGMYKILPSSQDEANKFRVVFLAQILTNAVSVHKTNLTYRRSDNTSARLGTKTIGDRSSAEMEYETTLTMLQWDGVIQALWLHDAVEGDMELVPACECEVHFSKIVPAISPENVDSHKHSNLKLRLRHGMAEAIGAAIADLGVQSFKDILSLISMDEPTSAVADSMDLSLKMDGMFNQDRLDVAMEEAGSSKLNHRFEALVSFRSFGYELDGLEQRVLQYKTTPDEALEVSCLRQLAGLWYVAKLHQEKKTKPKKKKIKYDPNKERTSPHKALYWMDEEPFDRRTTRLHHVEALLTRFGAFSVEDTSGHFASYKYGFISAGVLSSSFWSRVLTHPWMTWVLRPDMLRCGEEDDEEEEVSAGPKPEQLSVK